jgi:hypothetical protein
VTVPEAAAVAALAVNAGALVWGAATLKAEVGHVRQAVEKFEDLFENWTKVVAQHGERIARLEASQP